MTDYVKEDPESIQKMFDSIAHQYDRANALMSLNLHKRWNRKLIKTVTETGFPDHYLDLCCGTGEISLDLLQQCKERCEAFLLDFSQEMLECAKNKSEESKFSHHRMHFVNADAQKIPLPSESIDTVTVAYGIRNVHEPMQCAREVHRVLRSGGKFGILELTKPTNSLMKVGHKLYLKALLPLIGNYVTSNKEAYQYLSRSIQSFIAPDELENILQNAGFTERFLSAPEQ